MNVPLNVQVNAEAPVAEATVPPAHASLAGASRVGVLVLGMHRSGTSALARMLNLLGCSLPQTVLGANATNPAGHWESDAAMRFNEELLALAGSSWDDWLPISDGFFAAPGYAGLVARGVELLRGEFGDASLFVFKDPRNCRLARFWLDVFTAAAISPAVVIPIRNPMEVAQSLTTRDRVDKHYGPLLWLRHVLDAEASSRGKPRVFTSYDELIDCWEVVAGRLQGLGIGWRQMSPTTQEEIDSFIDKRHRREMAPPAAILSNPLVSGWVRRTYDILNRWAMDAESTEDHAELDAITHAFDEAAPAFARLIRRGTQAQQRAGDLERALVDAQAQTDATVADIEARYGQQLQSQHEALTQQLAQTSTECAALRTQIEELAGLRDAADSRAAAIEDNRAELARLLAEEQARAEAASQQLQEAVERLAEDANRVAEQESALIQRREENEQVWREITLEQALSADLRRQLAESSLREETQQRGLAEAEAWVFRLAGDRQAAQKEVADAQRARTELESMNLNLQREMGVKRMALAESERRREESSGELVVVARKLQAYERAIVSERNRAEWHVQAAQQVRDDQAELEASHLSLQTEMNSAREALAVLERNSAEEQVARRTREAELASARKKLIILERAQEEHSQEIRASEETMAVERDGAEWLREVMLVATRFPWWWRLIPSPMRRKRELARLRRRGLFDAAGYLAQHPDVSNMGVDPLLHYVRHGMTEGRPR